MNKTKTILTALFAVVVFATVVSGCNKPDDNTTTCSDGIKNGNETGIDCGGSCNACSNLPVACFTADDSVVTNAPIQFTNCSQQTTAYSWSFGDGSSSTAANPDHTYTANGTYTVTLTATNATGTNTTTRTVTVYGYTSASYTGTFVGTEACTLVTVPTYTAQVVANGTYGIIINNFGNFNPAINVSATLSGSGFTIPNQTHGTIQITAGTGSLSSNLQNLTYSYTCTDGANTDNCVGSLTRQ